MNSPMNGKLIEIRDLSAGYSDSVNIINDITMGVEDGEILTLIGPNGAGKSTLIKILSGALRKDSGEILIEEKMVDISGPKAARKMGIETIYQDLALSGSTQPLGTHL